MVNKVDHPTRDALVPEFFAMGLGQPYAVLASHGRGIDDLLDAVCEKLAIETNHNEDPAVAPFVASAARSSAAAAAHLVDDADDADAEEYSYGDERDAEASDTEGGAGDGEGVAAGDCKPNWRATRHDPNRPLRVAFVGRPNACKSSLTNRLVGEERSLVHDVAGTTTDPVDSEFSIGHKKYVLVDTAGIRKRAKVDEDIEKIAVSMAISQIDRADVVVLVIDALTGPSEQDARLLGMIEKAGRAAIIAMNKSDRGYPVGSGQAQRSRHRQFSLCHLGASGESIGDSRRRR